MTAQPNISALRLAHDRRHAHAPAFPQDAGQLADLLA